MAINLGIIGYGGMAGWHRKNAPRVEGVNVVAAYDIDPVRVGIAREDGLIGYDKLEDLLADETINTILVATPNDIHPEMAIAASKAGKHVISEKPVAMSVEKLDSMIDAAKQAGKLFTVHQNRRWDKDFLTAKSVIESGVLGKVYSIQSRLHGSGGVMHGWRSEKEHGGGMLYDWGVHFLDQILFMCGFDSVKTVTASFSSVINPEVDDYIFLLLDLKDGRRVQVEIGTYVLKESPRWLVMGDEATLFIQDFNCKEGAVVKIDSLQEDKPVIIMTSAGPTRTFAPRPDNLKENLPLPEITADWTEYYANLSAAIEGKEELIVKPEQVRQVVKLMEACFKSAETGVSVTL